MLTLKNETVHLLEIMLPLMTAQIYFILYLQVIVH